MHLWKTKLALLGLAAALLLPALGTSPRPAAARSKGLNLIDLKKVPKPKITGAEIIEGLEEFVERFPLRQQGLPNNIAAAEFLAAEAKKNGFKSRILDFPTARRAPQDKALVVEAIKKGTKKPNEWIALIAHYDIVPGVGVTVQGAYDDGSGTNMMRFFGKAFKKIKTDRSIVLLWFDAEENGLIASAAYAEKLAKKGQKVHAALGFDMVGIGHPAPYCICIYHGPNPADAVLAEPIVRHVNFDFLDFPQGDGGPAATQKWPVGGDGHVCFCGPNIRNSDEQNFAKQGWFSLRWTGMRTASDYPGYHQPWDTVPFMELVAEGRDNLEAGTENTFLSAYYTIHVLDKL
ncbi:MAG TPA: M28 family peptidase [Actinomycetota bacterium]|nr:M28 family peptidase [Actinomycetota bacterium]